MREWRSVTYLTSAQEAELFGISLAKYIENSKITASDISEKALEVARENAKELLENKSIDFVKSDMFQNIEGKFDIIVSNPPYIKTNTIKDYILEYEPSLALDRWRRRAKLL